MFDHPVVQHCQLHKIRNITDRLPNALASTEAKRIRRADHRADALVAEADFEALARALDRSNPAAAASLREGGRDAPRHPSGRATHARPSPQVNELDRVDDRHLPRPRRQRQALAGRPDGAALDRRRDGEAASQFRRVNGYLHLPALRVTLDATVTPTKEDAAA